MIILILFQKFGNLIKLDKFSVSTAKIKELWMWIFS